MLHRASDLLNVFIMQLNFTLANWKDLEVVWMN